MLFTYSCIHSHIKDTQRRIKYLIKSIATIHTVAWHDIVSKTQCLLCISVKR